MTDLTKLADALELKGQSWQELKDREEACREAARILRAAASVDVAGLMTLVDEHGSTRWGTGFNEGAKRSGDAAMNDRKALQQRAALESALRMALAAREGTPPNTAGGAFFQQCTAFTAPKGTP